ncbi:hypothetical protein NDU88_001162 [Pleurodeles waltl]|uniref:Uncharacterized protein n=1 Tax=Pleurodeles waltl TaxID=8319 RepID=A0AAV7VYL9_PLEWA|nr:hypothetical protein NDU88_001162 [Pleurodeles waltl]
MASGLKEAEKSSIEERDAGDAREARAETQQLDNKQLAAETTMGKPESMMEAIRADAGEGTRVAERGEVPWEERDG